jgi:hypothetical protein
MVLRRYFAGGLALAGVLGVAGCTSSTGAPSGATTTSAAGGDTTVTTGGQSARGAVNVPVSNGIRAQLVATGAALNNIPASEFTGLTPGLTYYAFDRDTNTYWAGARLDPAPSANPSSPTQAQISSQDAGSYYIFEQPRGGSWTAYAAGNIGPGTACPVVVPAAVLTVWGWAASGCRPSGA